MPKPEIYISVDIEADGPLPGPNSMLSLGAAAFALEEKEGELVPRLVSTWTANLQQIEGATMDPNTKVFWGKNPAAWAECRKEPLLRADLAMETFAKWVTSFKRKENGGYRPVFVGAPAGFDFTYVYWYLIRFYGSSPFSFSGLDMKTYVSAVMDLPYHDSGKRSLIPTSTASGGPTRGQRPTTTTTSSEPDHRRGLVTRSWGPVGEVRHRAQYGWRTG